MRLADVVSASRAVADTTGRLEKIGRLARLLKQLAPDEVEIAVAFLSGSPVQGRIGVAWSTIARVRAIEPSAAAILELKDVDTCFGRIAATSGRGAAGARDRLLHDLFSRATFDEQDFLVRLISGELRQGALEGVLIEAVSRAAAVPADRIRRAAMLAGTLAPVARAVLAEAEQDLSRFSLQLFQPIQPMLAQTAVDVDEALEDLGEASLEYKLDGARIQMHKSGDDIKVYTRNLRDVTGAVPEVVEAGRTITARELVLDGEAIAVRPDGTPQPFQITMRRFGRKLDVEKMRASLPVVPIFFDCLYLDGDPIIDQPHARRSAAMAERVPVKFIVPRIVTASAAEAADFFECSLRTGHEGVMAKAVNGFYAAGRRGQAWLKIKRARTLDLVVLAAEWGHGRRRGSLSNLHLGARSDQDGFVMLGKTFKGLTDEMLGWQTKKLLELEVARDAYTVYVRPELVVEIAFNDLQESPVYSGGLALRFARVKRYRTDKAPGEADTFAAVQQIYRQTTGCEPPVARN
ncbi:MAG: ATP-dependent DNA ligase [Blastocatellia bacterium]|nr:MAG: ATP-dependent DNA ligase [Blastocatellia bacterium]